MVQKHVNLVDLVKSFQTNIYYLLARVGFDTAENEPEYESGISLIFVFLVFGPGSLRVLRASGRAGRAPAHEGLRCLSHSWRRGLNWLVAQLHHASGRQLLGLARRELLRRELPHLMRRETADGGPLLGSRSLAGVASYVAAGCRTLASDGFAPRAGPE